MRSFDPLHEGDAPKVELAEVTESPRVFAGSPDGTLIAAGGSDPRVVLYDRERRLSLGSFPVADRITDLAFSPDGKTLASVDYRGRIQIFDTRTATEREAVRRSRLAAGGKPGWQAAAGPRRDR
jgi:WD40 repeat protein